MMRNSPRRRSRTGKIGTTTSVLSLPLPGNIIFNLSASTLALADNAAVASWTDSVNSVVLAQGTAGSRPLFKTNQANGKPCVRFDGVDDVLFVAAAGTALKTTLDSGNCTVIVVAKNIAAAGGAGCIFGVTAGGDSPFLVADGTFMGRFNATLTDFVVPITSGTFHTFGYTSSTNNYSGATTGMERDYMDGTCFAAGGQAPVTNGTNITVGSATIVGSLNSNSDLFDVVVWNTMLTQTQIMMVVDYFYTFYGQAKPWAAKTYFTLFDGNSLTSGVGAANTQGMYPYQTAQSLGLAFGQWTQTGIGGISVDNMQANMSLWSGVAAYIGKPVKVAAFEWYNTGGQAMGTQESLAVAYIQAVRALANHKIAWGTSWSTINDPNDRTRDTYNTYFDGAPTTMDAYVPIHNSLNIGVDGPDAGGGNAYFVNNGLGYWSDGLHLTASGYAFMAALFVTGLNSISFP